MSAKLLICVVRRGRGDYLVSIAKQAAAPGATIAFGRGTARNGILRILGLADTEKELVFLIGETPIVAAIMAALRSAPDLCRKTPGIGLVIDVSAFFRGELIRDHSLDQIAAARPGNPMDRDHELICVIVNAGYADDIMFAARDAGATGGTILRARGTATGKDASFFGVAIVPEKEFLMILVKKDAYQPILEAVRDCPCLAEPGVGIVFSMPVDEFFTLGRHKG